MKNTSLVLLLTFSSLICFGQIKSAEEINDKMSEGMNRGFKILVPEASEKATVKAWQKLMKEYQASTEKVKKDEDYKSSEVSMPAISDQPVTVFTNFQQTPEGVYVKSFLKLGDMYLNSDMQPEKVASYKEILQKFATETTKVAIEEKLAIETRDFEKLEKEMNKLKKEQSTSEAAIKSAEETIAKNKKLLAENATAQANKAKVLAEQRVKKERVKAKLEKY